MHSAVQAGDAGGSRACVSTIVVVDGDNAHAQRVQTILTQQGHTVRIVPDGRACLEHLSQGTPDVIIMDLRIDAAYMQEILCICRCTEGQTTVPIPILFMTPGFDEADMLAAFAAGGCDYLSKPVRAQELLARVSAAVGRRTAQRLEWALESAGNVCHELNQPLQYLLGSIQLLLMDFCDGDPLTEKMRTMAERAEEMGRITQRLNQIVRGRCGR